MSYSNTNTSNAHTANGVLDTFAIGFSFVDSAQVKVRVIDDEGADVTPITFTVVGTNVVLDDVPEDTFTVLIYRDTAPVHDTLYSTYEFPYPTVNNDLDKIYQLAQENKKRLDRAILNDDPLSGADQLTIDDLVDAVASSESITDIDTRLGTAETDITALEGRVDAAETDITELDTRIDGAETDITAIDGRLTTVEDAVDALGDIAALESRVDAIETDVSTLDTRTGELEDYYVLLDGRVINLEEAVTNQDVITTKGDIIAGNALGNNARVSVGLDGQVLVADSASTNGVKWDTIVEGGAGGINYITNPDFEVDASGYSSYADAAGTIPVDGDGGSPVSTFARSTSSPLRGVASGLFSKDASNRQGEGFSVPFTVDNADLAKKLTISFDYDATDADYVDGDIKLFVYDITNAVLIRVNGEDLRGGSGTAYAQFQTAYNSTSYRLIFHISTTNAAAYDIKFDNIKVGPTNLAFGAIATDWEAVNLTGTWTTNTTYESYYRRVGDSLEIQSTVLTSGTPNTATLQITLPFGLSADASKIPATDRELGTAWVHDTTTANRTKATVELLNSTTIQFVYIAGSTITQAAPFAFGASDSVSFRVTIPIAGWSSKARMSEDLGGRDVVFSVQGNTAQTFSTTSFAYDAVTFAAAQVVKDTVAGFDDANDSYIIKETGYYDISGGYGREFGAAPTAGLEMYLVIFVNGTDTKQLAQQRTVTTDTIYFLSGAISNIYLEKGDEIQLVARKEGTAASSKVGDARSNYLYISKRSSPQTMLETETVAARYTSNAGQSIPNNVATTMIFEDIDFDTHGAMNTATGEYTIPVSDKYIVSGSSAIFQAFTAGNLISTGILKNGNAMTFSGREVEVTATYRERQTVSQVIDCVKGDIITMQFFQNSGGSLSIETTSGLNTFSIARLK